MSGQALTEAALPDPGILFSFRSIAVIGASEDITRIGGAPIHLLKSFGFDGQIFGVNPKYSQVQGVPCVPRIEDLPDGIDLAAICVSAEAAREGLPKLVGKGIRGAVVFSGGFAETGPEGLALQQWLAAFARQHGITVLGPNCAGHIAFGTGRIVTFASQPMVLSQPAPGPVALLSQSGGVAFNIWADAMTAGARFSHLITTGNEGSLTFSDLLAYLADDPSVQSIIGYIEGLSDGASFCAAAQALNGRRKPLILLKGGVSEAGWDAAASHTAQLSSADAGYQAAFDRYGVIRVKTLQELNDHARLLSLAGIAGRLTLATNSGGAGVYMADLCARFDVPMAVLSPRTVERLAGVVPSFGRLRNPVDVTAQVVNDMSILESTIDILLDDPNTGMVLFALTGKGQPEPAREVVETFRRLASRTAKPVILCWLGVPDVARQYAGSQGVHVYSEPARFLQPLGNYLRSIGAGRALAGTVPPPPDIDREALRQSLVTLETGGRLLPEGASMDLLEAAGVPCPRRWFVNSTEGIGTIAAHATYPLVMKMSRPAVAHKSDVGGVIIGIRSPEELRAAWDRISARALEVMVCEQITGGLEILVGCVRDPVFGMRLTLSAGGIWAEASREAVTLIPPFTADYIRAALPRLPVWAALQGGRGRPALAIDELVRAVVDIGRLSLAITDDVREFECNPVIVTETRAVAVDAIGFADPLRE